MYIGWENGRHRLKRSIWANPYNKPFRDGLITRQEAVECYLVYVLRTPELREKLPEVHDKVLGCWCAPELCHGDVLLRLAEGWVEGLRLSSAYGTGPLGSIQRERMSSR